MPTKAPKIKNNTPSNNVIEKIEEKLENCESSNKHMKVALASNMEAIDGRENLFEIPPLPTKAPKIKNMSKKNNTPSNNVMMEKIEKIEEKLENCESSNKDVKVALASNMKAIDGLNTKLDKISLLLGVLTENGGNMSESYPVRHSDFFLTIYRNGSNFSQPC